MNKAKCDNASKISKNHVYSAREEYSEYLKREIDDELKLHWPEWEEVLQAISTIGRMSFQRDDFQSKYDSIKSANNTKDSGEALRILYDFSVVGYQKAKPRGGSQHVYRYKDVRANWDQLAQRLQVHKGLKEYAQLQEGR